MALLSFCAVNTAAQADIIRKTVDRTAEPAVAPALPPEIEGSEEAVKILTPPPQPTAEFAAYTAYPGLFKQNLNSEINGSYLFHQGLMGMLHLGVNALIKDPNHFGEKLGLAEDALEYKVGLGIDFGLDFASHLTFSLPLYAGAALYFKEGSLYGFDPFIGGGFNLNLIGTDFRFGGFGYQFYGGILADFDRWPGGKTGFAVGYNRSIVEGARTMQGYYLAAILPIKL